VAELLENEVMAGASLIAGHAGVNRTISAVNVMTVPDIHAWVRADEFILATGYPFPRDDVSQVRLLTDLCDLGTSGIGVKLDRYLPKLSESIIETAEELGMPLVVIPEGIRFDDILIRAYTTIVNRQAAALARAQEIHNSFLDISLSGGGLRTLAGKLSSLLNEASVLITDPQGSVVADAGDAALFVNLGLLDGNMVQVSRLGRHDIRRDEDTGRRWMARQIRAGDVFHGFVVVAEASAPFGDFSLVAVDQAAIVAALEITRDLAIGAVQRRFSSNVLFELITGGDNDFATGVSRGTAFGWDLDRELVVLVGRRDLSPQTPFLGKEQSQLVDDRGIAFWVAAVRRQDPGAAAAALGSEWVAVIGAAENPGVVARAVQTEVSSLIQGCCSIGVSRPYQGPAGIAVAYSEARLALRLGLRVSGPSAVIAYGELGLFQLLAQLGDDELRKFADETLGPLLRLKEPERSEMLRTLEALVEHDMNMAETARQLHYHYNTVRYRLTKLERLLGPFTTSTAVTTRVCVALQVMQMQTTRTDHGH